MINSRVVSADSSITLSLRICFTLKEPNSFFFSNLTVGLLPYHILKGANAADLEKNDFNLNKVAELQGVKVLNINELANALKPIVIPGEMMQVKILKEGKEQDQGVAYLDDGTMVVVDNGRRRIGQTLSVTITSVLQTQAGRMIFAKPSDESR